MGRSTKLALGGAAAAALVGVAGGLVGPTGGDGHTLWPAYIVVYVGLLGLAACWLMVGRDVRDGRALSLGQLRTVLIAWSAPLALAPPLFSRDIFSYAAQGRLAAVGLNPYHFGPGALGAGPFLRNVSPMWEWTRAPYGPLFTGLDAGIARLVGPHLVLALIGLRLLALCGVALLVVFVPRLAATRGVDPRFALWLAALSPLAILHFVSGAHNDALMLGLVVAGLALAGEGRPVAGLVLCTLGAAVKIPAVVAVLYVGVEWVSAGYGRRISAALAARAAAIVALTFGGVTWLSGLGWGWLPAVVTPGRTRSFLSLTTALGMAAGALTERMGLHHSYDAAVIVSRAIGTVVAVAIAGVVLARRRRVGTDRAVGLTLLAVVALGPVVLPWYLLWGLVILAAAGPGLWLPALVWVGAAGAMILMPDGTSWADIPMIGFLVLTAALVVRSVPWAIRTRPVPAVQLAA